MIVRGQKVTKTLGYPFDGTVQAVFTNRKGELRVVVELDRGFPGDMLHIFSLEQLEITVNPPVEDPPSGGLPPTQTEDLPVEEPPC